MGILGLRKGHCESDQYRSNHRSASSSSGDEDVSVRYKVQNSNDEDITFHSTLNQVRPMPTGASGDNQPSNFPRVGGSDDMQIRVKGTGNEVQNGKNGSVNGLDIKQDKPEILTKPTTPKHVNVTYWLWIGPDPASAEKHNMTVRIETNATFYAVMQRAASLNHTFM